MDFSPTQKTVVVAIGGNSLISDPDYPDTSHQWDSVRETADQLAALVKQGWQMVITHGNGPQTGFILRRNELAAHEVHPTPLDLIVADTQGAIGYMLQQALKNSLRTIGMNRSVFTIVNQTLVKPDDPAFDHPTKPIGSFMSEEQAKQRAAQGWHVMEDAGRGWRRVVPSPQPIEIIEVAPIRSLVRRGYIVITAGGGGIPVYYNKKGELRGVEAVIDKDKASSLLAQQLMADYFIISTGVPQVALNYGKPDQKFVDKLTLKDTKRFLEDGHFAEGSMKPKIEAVIDFVEHGGPAAIITNPENMSQAIRGEAGTWILPK